MKTTNYQFNVTGTFHGSLVFANKESEARKLFHEKYNGESIVHLSVNRIVNGKRKTITLQTYRNEN